MMMMMNRADSVGKDQPFHLFSSTFRRLTGHCHNIYVATIEEKKLCNNRNKCGET